MEHLKLESFISLLTTTIRGNLEQQLDDRILTINTDTSPQQTVKVIVQLAADPAGVENNIDETVLHTWQCFHDLLEPKQVVVPFAQGLLKNLPDSAPVAARRAFTRVVSAIKTFAVLYQAQRDTDEHGRLIAEYADYAMAFQLIENSFAESMKGETGLMDERLRLLKAEKMMTPKALSEKFQVSSPVITEWIKSVVEKGLVTWCDEYGRGFDDINALNKAKYTGKGYVRVVAKKSLPTPYELTGDPRWGKHGDLEQYNLHLDAEGPVKEKISGAGGGLYVICNDLIDFGIMNTVPDKSILH